MISDAIALPVFRYFPDPAGYGCIAAKAGLCACCGQPRSHMYVGPIYCRDRPEHVCPWCIADGSAAKEWSAIFNDPINVPRGVPNAVVDEIMRRTPGYWTWQGNSWLFSDDDAMVLLGAVDGSEIVKEGNPAKIDACMRALRSWTWTFEVTIEFLEDVVPHGMPALHWFQDRRSGSFAACADMT
jgi:uncharacterized protein CbrC (UPF0167 family)